MFEFYHTRNIVRDWLGVVERKKKGEKKKIRKDRKKEEKEKREVFELERKKVI